MMYLIAVWLPAIEVVVTGVKMKMSVVSSVGLMVVQCRC